MNAMQLICNDIRVAGTNRILMIRMMILQSRSRNSIYIQEGLAGPSGSHVPSYHYF